MAQDDHWLITIQGPPEEAAARARDLGADVRRVHTLVPCLAVTADAKVLARLAAEDWVVRLEPDLEVGPA
jgi:hypothetical protein